jgi:phage shock protein A
MKSVLTLMRHLVASTFGAVQMSIFNRLSDIINSNFNALLDKAEDPAKILRLMIQEMEDALVEVRSHAAKTIAERKERERILQRVAAEQIEWQGKAELALSKDRDDLAKAALQHKSALQEYAAMIEKETALLSEQVAKSSDDIGQLEAKLKEAKTRQRTIMLRYDHASTTLRSRNAFHQSKLDDMMDRFAYAERRIDGIEAEAESLELGRSRSLAQEIESLQAEDRINAELAALKARVKGAV